jgi:hypothetical protein
MKIAAFALGLIALVAGAYGAAVPAQAYRVVHSEWSSGSRGAEHERLGDLRSELRGTCQTMVMITLPLAVIGLALGFLARRKQKGWMPLAAMGGSLIGLIGAVVILSANVF